MSKTAKTTLALMLVTIFSKVIGLIRETVMAATYGTSMYKAVYDIANNIPVVIFAIVGTALATSYIPVFNKVEKERGKGGAIEFTNSIINIVIIICLLLSLLGIAFAKPLVKIFAIGYEGEAFKLAVHFTRILLPTIIFVGVANILTSFLQVKGKFIIPGLVGVPYNIIIIASIIISKNTTIFVLVIGTFFAILSKTLFMVFEARRQGLRYRPKFNLKDDAIKEMVNLILPVLIGVGASQINSTIDKSLATTLGFNVVSSFGYAMKLYEFVQALFITSILAVVYPRLAKYTAFDKMNEFNDSLRKTINIVIVALVPIVIGACVLSSPIVRVIFQRRSFTISDTIVTANILMFYTVGLLAFAIRDVITRGFYSMHDSKTPMTNSIIAIIFNIGLNLALIKPLGYKGLALATAVSAYIGLFLFIRSLKKKAGDFGLKNIGVVSLKSFVGAGLMGVCSYFTYNFATSVVGQGFAGALISLALAVTIGATVYAIAMYLLKVDEFNEVIFMVKGGITKKLAFLKRK